MNGAAMNCRQDPVLRPPHQEASSLRNPGYHLQINCQQNLQPQNSKTLNYPSFSNNYQVDDFYNNLHRFENVDSRHSIREIQDPRFKRPRATRGRNEPIDLPVPRFEIDEHSVSDLQNANSALVRGSKGLDLDTRIGLLIKSKALAGMHPIFSDLISEDSESDLDDSFISRPRSKLQKKRKSIPSPPREIVTPIRESFDDPEKPLSRPPSPFLSRATYLFWFNKAIEIKQQAKAQEQELLEQAAKRLIQDNSPSLKTNQLDRTSPKKPILKSLMDEISKELKEVVKKDFLREVIEETAFSTFDDWWEKQKQEEKSDVPKNEFESLQTVSNMNDNYQDTVISEYQGSTSPKMPFPWKKNTKLRIEEDTVKQTCRYEKICEDEALKVNHIEEFGDPHPIQLDRNTISSNFVTQKDQESQGEKLVSDSKKKNCDVNCQQVCYNIKKIENCVREVPSTWESTVLDERNETVKFLPSSCDSAVDNKLDEKYVIVNSILDLILKNMSTIIVQRDGKRKTEFQDHSNMPISMDSLVTENMKVDSNEEFFYGTL